MRYVIVDAKRTIITSSTQQGYVDAFGTPWRTAHHMAADRRVPRGQALVIWSTDQHVGAPGSILSDRAAVTAVGAAEGGDW